MNAYRKGVSGEGTLVGSTIILATALALLGAIRAEAGCRSDEYQSGEDEDFVYCTKLADRAALTEAMNTFTQAARFPSCVGDERCNLFVARVAELREVTGIPYLRDVLYPGKLPNDVGGRDEQRVANDVYDFIEKAVRSRPSGWRKVGAQDAQESANRGKFVLAVARALEGRQMGHVAVVAPAQMAHARDGGADPWVRDSSSAELSRRANERFCSERHTPSDKPCLLTKAIYAVWDPGR